ncbi:MEDS domain-containing protein [Spirillospora sp. NPDC050679]
MTRPSEGRPPPAGRLRGTAPQAGRPAALRDAAVQVGEVVLGDHLCLTYDSDAERYAVLAAYLRDGLAARHRVLYLADEDDPDAALSRLAAAVAASGVPGAERLDLRAAAGAGDLVVRSIVDAFLDGGRFDPDRTAALLSAEIDRALAEGHRGVRVTGENSFSLRGWPGGDRLADLERHGRLTLRAGDARATALCQYDRRWFDPGQLRVLEDCHDGRVRVDDLYDDRVLRITPMFTPPGLRLTGAIDESTLPALHDALVRAAGGAGHFCLDLSGLEFCDMAGLDLLLRAGRLGPGPGRQVILRGAPSYLGLMMDIGGRHAPPGVHREEAPR